MQALATLTFATLILSPIAGAVPGDELGPVPIHAAIRAASPEVQVFNGHLTVLASPWMDGRLPGTRGFELASEYMEDHFKKAGLLPPVEKDGVKSYRHSFNLGGTAEITGAGFDIVREGKRESLEEGKDFTLTSLGRGTPTAGLQAVFVGYGIDDGPGEYATFTDTDDLTGKVAVVFRFEPMEEDGTSRWSDRGWSGKASFASKLGTVLKRKPAAVLLINPPGAADPRAKTLMREASRVADIPVYMMSAEGADKLFKAADSNGRDALAMRQLADKKGVVMALPKATLDLRGTVEEKPVETANVVGVLPGRGALKDEYIIIGGHLDHLGHGYFGSREGSEGPGKLHPGADDNASGAAGVIMLAESLAKAYKALPEDAPARSILFMGFSAEESGLNGSEAYVDKPIYPLDKTMLMMNFDMIGRIQNKRLSVSGTDTGVGMHDWIQPFFAAEKCGLDVQQGKRTGPGGSDHTSFVRRQIPVLFAIIADFHDDYHTSRDTEGHINREDAVLAIQLWHEIALAAAQRPERFAFNEASGGGGAGGMNAPVRTPKVRFGLQTEEVEGGLKIVRIVEGASAAVAGLKVDDLIVKFNKKAIKNRNELMEAILELEVDDTVQVEIVREGGTQAVYVKMQAVKAPERR